jgi:hypothetical protein
MCISLDFKSNIYYQDVRNYEYQIQCKSLGSDEGNVLGTEMLRVCSRGTELGVWAEFVFGGQHYEAILMTLERLCFEEKFF